MEETTAILLLPLACIVAGIVVVAMGLYKRLKILEMAHRERLAMIERGITPPPATDPELPFAAAAAVRRGAVGRRSMTLGILLIGAGLGLGLLIGFAAGAPDSAVGVGGAIVLLGAALVVNALVMGRGPAAAPAMTSLSPPAVPSTIARREPTDLP
jgi:hypothetical protein